MRTWTGSTSGPWRSSGSTPGSAPPRSAPATGTLRGVRISTGAGPARAELDAAEDPPVLLVLTRVVQPYRVRGARAPGSAARQDEAWLELIGKLRRRFPGVPLVQGGRSNGARVACRTARAASALAVLALAFPLHPPGRPDRSRAAELAEAGTDVLVVNGANDPFGIPEAAGAIRVVVLPGAAHALAGQGGAIRRVVGSWLGELLLALGAGPRKPRLAPTRGWPSGAVG